MVDCDLPTLDVLPLAVNLIAALLGCAGLCHLAVATGMPVGLAGGWVSSGVTMIVIAMVASVLCTTWP